ncbi:hypothetical protein PY093_02605 [Cytobacillus sp. S13-E01]|uniref:hypothetical protein n=1 Tax=Cytobacillus sp. S13-E01 TaxID=3031326 RepID=UPI0023D7E863|nr:hypothetical protein [Cytobacillus sp. S13-E01]MDF0725604.1 hypothetical protein [Cytobacillus sp. S13-E01]
MSLEWFDRVSGELQDHLESICDKYDQVGHMSIDRGAKHPRIEFFVDTREDDGRDYFCTLFYDPNNEEFYVESFDFEFEQTSRTLLSDIEDIVDAVHESFHEYMNEDDDDIEEFYVTEDDDGEEYLLSDDDEFEEYYASEDDTGNDIMEEIDVEWTTPEVTAYEHEDEVTVTYQFGIVEETGDGVLRRVNRVRTIDEELIEDETNFIFSKEEASTIITMIASNMDYLSELNFDQLD